MYITVGTITETIVEVRDVVSRVLLSVAPNFPPRTRSTGNTDATVHEPKTNGGYSAYGVTANIARNKHVNGR